MLTALTVASVTLSAPTASAVPADASDVSDLRAACSGFEEFYGAGYREEPFEDIAGQPASTRYAINCLNHYGVTFGTNVDGTRYAPDRVVTRLEMAIFISRFVRFAWTGSAEVRFPEVDLPTGFDDVDDELAQVDVRAVAMVRSMGVTTGRDATTFAPYDPVTRAEMALFLNRTQDWLDTQLPGEAGYDPAAATARFTDVAPGSPAAPAIAALQGAGIVQGTGDGRYSPEATVPRWQMALFLVRQIDENVTAERLLRLPEAYGNDEYLVSPADGATVEDDGRVTSAVTGAENSTATALLVRADRVLVTGRFVLSFPGVDAVGADPVAARIVAVNGLPVEPATAASLGLDERGQGRVAVEVDGVEEVVLVVFADEDGDGVLDVDPDGYPTEDFGLSGTLVVAAP